MKNEGCICQNCGKVYQVDILVSNELWDKINPNSNGGGLWCGSCIAQKIEDISSYESYNLNKTMTQVKIVNYLRKNRIHTWTRTFTTDNSILMSFKDKGIVDIYEDTIVVIVDKNCKEEIYEFGYDELNEVIELLISEGFDKYKYWEK